jgi:PPOX class probable F420-dependent enzyme
VPRRSEIALSPAEVSAYLNEQRVIQVASVGPNGRPHLAPLWFVPQTADDDRPAVATWTYAKSQKALNLRRLPQATVLVESGQTYQTLRGVSMECDVEILDDYEPTLRIGEALAERYGISYGQHPADVIAAFAAQARKRVGLVLTATRVASWDHAKLGGG